MKYAGRCAGQRRRGQMSGRRSPASTILYARRSFMHMENPGDHMSQASTVTFTLESGIATVTIRGERRLNVVGSDTLRGMIAAGAELARHPDLRLVVLSGEGERAFIGGADIAELAELDSRSGRAFITLVHEACEAFRRLPVPSIARIRGYCLGAGMEIAAACDLRIGSNDSVFGMPEVQVGLPSVVEAALLPTLIGWGKTRELLYTGAQIDAAEAHRLGFLQNVTPPDELDAALQTWIDAIAAADPAAIRAQKKLIEYWLDHGIAAGIPESIEVFSATFQSQAPNRRLRAFLQRPRRPRD